MARVAIAVVLTVLIAWGCGGFAAQPADDSRGFAVVELFTSEASSSCPPADALLGELAAESRREGSRVFALAYHVDTPTRPGAPSWKDRFADGRHAARQNAYASALSVEASTPQMIVSGTTEVAGTDEPRARRAIAEAMKGPANAPVTLHVIRVEPGAVGVRYSVALPESVDMVTNARLHVALVEDGLSTEVSAGENAGKTLQHDAVVRAFETLKPGEMPAGTFEIRVPKDVKPENASIIAFVQHERTMAIHGAASAPLKK